MPFKFDKAKSWNNLGKKAGKSTKSVLKTGVDLVKTPFDIIGNTADNLTSGPGLFTLIIGVVVVGGVVMLSGSSRRY